MQGLATLVTQAVKEYCLRYDMGILYNQNESMRRILIYQGQIQKALGTPIRIP